MAEPWQTAEIPGPKKALVITKPKIVSAMIRRAKRPILIVGHEAAEIALDGESLIDYLIKLSKLAGMPIVATAHTVKYFIQRKFRPDAWMPILDIANRLGDSSWSGLDGDGQYDLAIFVGIQYYMEWVVLSGLKHFSQKLKTISLDRFYQPHASWSFPNLNMKDWIACLKVIEEDLKERMKHVHV